MKQFQFTAALVLYLTFIGGCGGGREPYKKDLVKVTGTLKIDDKPLAGATVTFTPAGNIRGLGATGRSDANGNYALKTPMGHEGILPGEYKVTVSKLVDKTGKE